jgi:hypothetical protein
VTPGSAGGLTSGVPVEVGVGDGVGVLVTVLVTVTVGATRVSADLVTGAVGGLEVAVRAGVVFAGGFAAVVAALKMPSLRRP